MGPLLTLNVHEALRTAARKGVSALECSLDLDRSRTTVEVASEHWCWQGMRYPFLPACKDRTIYYWSGEEFAPVARYTNSLIKLVPTPWGAPTFEIDGIKMLPTAKVSPYEDAQRKVALVRPHGKAVLDTCGGLGYFAAWCLQGRAASVLSFEKSEDVLWLRQLNPWSPVAAAVPPESSSLGPADRGGLTLVRGDVATAIGSMPERAFDAVLHDPPRFGIAGELYSQTFYDHLARVMRPRALLFHYTGTPNKLTSGRDVPKEVAGRLRQAGFATGMELDGVLAVRR